MNTVLNIDDVLLETYIDQSNQTRMQGTSVRRNPKKLGNDIFSVQSQPSTSIHKARTHTALIRGRRQNNSFHRDQFPSTKYVIMAEAFGTTPLPVALDSAAAFSTLHVLYDPFVASGSDASQLQQPIQQEIASFTAENADYALSGASVVAVNQHFVIYAVKKGLIRVLHRHSSMKSLFRQHQNETVSDIQIFQNGEVLASVSSTGNGATLSSKAVVWRVHERTSDIMTSPLLEIQSRSILMIRVIWHPSDVNQFWLIHSRGDPLNLVFMASLVNTTRINTKLDPTSNHPVAEFSSATTLQQQSTVLFSDSLDNSLQDLSWCGSDSQYAVAAFKSGDVVLYDLKTTNAELSPVNGQSNASCPAVLQKVNQGSSVTRCLFLPHFDVLSSNSISGSDPTTTKPARYSSCFLTGGEGSNAEFTLWSPFSPIAPPMKIQVVRIAAPSRSYVLSTCFGPAPATGAPPSCFVTACCREFGAIYAFHLKAAWSLSQVPLLVGSDYVVPFSTKYPVLSATVTCAPSSDISEEVLLEQGGIIFDMKLFVYQTAVVQCLTLTSFMCLPPAIAFSESTRGVTVNCTVVVAGNESALLEAAPEVDINSLHVFEEYDIEDDEGEVVYAPEPSALPMPNEVFSHDTSNDLPSSSDPFANWLGAVAAKPLVGNAIESNAVPHLKNPHVNPVPTVAESTTAPAVRKSTLLSPMEILGMNPLSTISSDKPTIEVYGISNQNSQAAVDDSNGRREYMSGKIPSLLDIQAIVHKEIHSLIVPLIRQELETSMESMSSKISLILGSVEQVVHKVDDEFFSNGNLASSFALNLQEPFRFAFSECIRNILLPAVDSLTSQVYAAVCKRIDDTLPAFGESDEKLDSILKQLSSMTLLVTELTKEVNVLRSTIVTTPSLPAPINTSLMQATVSKTAMDPFDEQRLEILQFLKDKNYESAFRRAVANATVDMTIFCCRKASLQDVFASGHAKLSQPILLCVLQQLGTVLVSSSDLSVILEWLQEISLSLYPPVDPQIRPHLPIVVKQVALSLSERMENDANDLTLQRSFRKLQSLLRGMLL